MDHDVTTEHLRLGVGAGMAGLFGLTLNQWVAVVTLIYFLLQIGLLLPKYTWFQRLRKWLAKCLSPK